MTNAQLIVLVVCAIWTALLVLLTRRDADRERRQTTDVIERSRQQSRDANDELHAAGIDIDDDLCPNCCTPWKCNGPHLEPYGLGWRCTGCFALLLEGEDHDCLTEVA